MNAFPMLVQNSAEEALENDGFDYEILEEHEVLAWYRNSGAEQWADADLDQVWARIDRRHRAPR